MNDGILCKEIGQLLGYLQRIREILGVPDLYKVVMHLQDGSFFRRSSGALSFGGETSVNPIHVLHSILLLLLVVCRNKTENGTFPASSFENDYRLAGHIYLPPSGRFRLQAPSRATRYPTISMPFLPIPLIPAAPSQRWASNICAQSRCSNSRVPPGPEF